MTRRDIVQQMAKALWGAVWLGGEPSRAVPDAAIRAAKDLASLYEKTNGQTLSDLAAQMRDFETGESPGEVLAVMALFEPELAPVGMRVPSFEVTFDGKELSWDGALHTAADLHSALVDAVGAPIRRNPDVEVLVIEDDEQLQKMYPRVIRKAIPGAKVHVVDNYTAAIGYLETHDIELVLSDVDIVGDRSGIDVFEWVKQHRPHMVDRYVFITGGNPHVQRLHYRYVEKPFQADELRDVIRDTFGGGTAPAPAEAPARSRTRARTSAPPKTRTVAQRSTTLAPPTRMPFTAMVMPLPDFVAQVSSAMGSVEEALGPGGLARGRFGPMNVFIAAIWRVLSGDPQFRMTLPQFKQRLVEANREGLLSLVRADSGGEMDPDEMQKSEIVDMGATFHFVIDSSRDYGRRSPARTAKPTIAPPPARTARPTIAPPTRSPTMAAPPMALVTIAAAVNETAMQIKATPSPRRGTMGRFGDKVYISAIWRVLSRDPRFHGMTLPQFKRHLVDANRQRYLDLARADLVGAMDPDEVTTSEIDDLGNNFHFVMDRYPSLHQNPPRKRPAPQVEDDDDGDDENAPEIDEALYQQMTAHQRPRPGTTPVTPDIARRLIALRKVAAMLSDENASYMNLKIDHSLATGVLDLDNEASLEMWGDDVFNV